MEIAETQGSPEVGTSEPAEEWLTALQAAALLKVSDDTIRYWAQHESLPVLWQKRHRGRPMLKVKRADLEAFVLRKHAGPIPPALKPEARLLVVPLSIGAKATHRSMQYLRAEINRGKLRATVIDGDYYLTFGDLDDWLSKQGRQAHWGKPAYLDPQVVAAFEILTEPKEHWTPERRQEVLKLARRPCPA